MKPLFRFAYQFLPDTAFAEDVVQETFIKVWKYRAKFDTQKKFSSLIRPSVIRSLSRTHSVDEFVLYFVDAENYR